MSPQCQTCESDVSATWRRVMGNNDGEVHGCPNCLTQREAKNGGAAGLDVRQRGLGLGGERA